MCAATNSDHWDKHRAPIGNGQRVVGTAPAEVVIANVDGGIVTPNRTGIGDSDRVVARPGIGADVTGGLVVDETAVGDRQTVAGAILANVEGAAVAQDGTGPGDDTNIVTGILADVSNRRNIEHSRVRDNQNIPRSISISDDVITGPIADHATDHVGLVVARVLRLHGGAAQQQSHDHRQPNPATPDQLEPLADGGLATRSLCATKVRIHFHWSGVHLFGRV